jgi:hypothetical protein
MCVVPQLVFVGPSKDAEKSWIAIGHPGAKEKPGNKDEDACYERVEEIEASHGTDADEKEESAFHPEISEGLMQASEYPIAARLLCHLPLHKLLAYPVVGENCCTKRPTAS